MKILIVTLSLILVSCGSEDYRVTENKVNDPERKTLRITENMTECPVAEIDKNSHSLLVAAGTGDELTLQSEVKNGKDINDIDSQGRTAISCSVWNGWLKTLKLSLEFGGNPNLSDVFGVSPLMISVIRQDEEIFNELLDAGIFVNAQNLRKESVLHIAVLGDVKFVSKLLGQNGVNLELTNDQHQTPLFVAVLEGKEDAVDLLLEAGANSYEINADKIENESIRQKIRRAQNLKPIE